MINLRDIRNSSLADKQYSAALEEAKALKRASRPKVKTSKPKKRSKKSY